jgi:lipopolysaccharide biosynthesis protein
MESIKAIAIYLPQFHPIPENDQWWGKGFTEWRNVTRARPLFPGHYQPHLPADLGFYDLRLAETRVAQAAMAREHGIHGFCYYHYWFNGRRILERPFAEVLDSGQPDFPFCLCWANENWTRRWDGSEQEILLHQNYSLADDEQHFLSLLPAFQDPRYIRIDGKPIFLVYRVTHLPEPSRTADLWQKLAKSHGLPGIHLISVQSQEITDPRNFGFDAALEFQPSWLMLLNLEQQKPTLKERIKGKWRKESPAKRIHFVCDYGSVCEAALQRPVPDYVQYPCVNPSWDNTARRRWGGVILQDSSPSLYGRWLSDTIQRMPELNLPAPFLFINAWNEWAEGNHLEPDLRWGSAYLQETRRALSAT